MASTLVSVGGWILQKIGEKVISLAIDRAAKRIGRFEATCQNCQHIQTQVLIPENVTYTLKCPNCSHTGEIYIESLSSMIIHTVQEARILVQHADIHLPNVESFHGYYYLLSKHSGKALDVCGSSKENGANVHQWSFHGGHNQQWRLVSASNGNYYIISKLSDKCLDVWGHGQKDGVNVIQWALHRGDNQQWTLLPARDGYYHILARHSRKCLDVYGWGQQDGTNIVQWSLHGGDNQQWRLQSV